MAQTDSATPRRDIDLVLRDHDKELMKLPNVVGVYVGVLDDGKSACLRVMLKEKSAAIEKTIPQSIEGYPVVTEVTGEIKPLASP